MTDLEVFRLSAEACKGQAVIDDGACWVPWGLSGKGAEKWNPFTNAEQRWQCVETLLKTHVIGMEQHFWRDGAAHCIWNKNGYKSDGDFFLDCPASEFPARALAELHRRNKEG